MERRRLSQRAQLDFDDLVYGIHAVDEALAAGEELRAIHVAADRTKDGALRALLAQAKEQNVPVRFEQRAFFDRAALQGAPGRRRDRAAVSVRRRCPTLLARKRVDGAPRSLVVLDHLTDPHNVGAIIRTAEAAGADGARLAGPALRRRQRNGSKSGGGRRGPPPDRARCQYRRGDPRR